MAGQRDDAVLGVRLHIAVVRDQRRAVQRLLDVQVDVERIDGVADIDIVPDVADTGQADAGDDVDLVQVADLGGRMGSVWGGRVTVLV